MKIKLIRCVALASTYPGYTLKINKIYKTYDNLKDLAISIVGLKGYWSSYQFKEITGSEKLLRVLYEIR